MRPLLQRIQASPTESIGCDSVSYHLERCVRRDCVQSGAACNQKHAACNYGRHVNVVWAVKLPQQRARAGAKRLNREQEAL